ncbi:MAG TPA: homocysteine S-methyltransferase family protein, partial [Tepidiformaceae bacterium]|nr:homocysteine S-methyltransferase family protein [Tepidiformaceae bacterium]
MYRPLDHPLLHRLREQVLYSAGPIGSTLLSLNLKPEAYVAADGEDHDGCPEWLNVSNPAILEGIYASFYEVGVDAADSCSFGANPVVLAEFDLADRTRELNKLAAEVIGRVRDRYSTPDHPRYAFGTMGPGTKLPSLGHITWDELVEGAREQAIGLIEGGIDVLKVETCQDLLQTKAYLTACEQAFEVTGKRIPVIASVTIETTGTMLLGSDIACALTSLEPIDVVDIIGINCATGPEQMTEHVRYLAEHSRRPVFIGPNAGLPEVIDGQACYTLTDEQFAKHQHTFVTEFGTNIVAGCCGTTPAMFAAAIAAIGRRAPEFRPSRAEFLRGEHAPYEANVSSIYQSVPIEQDISFLVIGERTNATGSRAFRDLLLAEDVDGIVALAREQAAEGAHVIDVMVDYVGRDGVVDM